MNEDNYKEKLIKFNSTIKYEEEVTFLISLLHPMKNDLILDYGCGTGSLLIQLRNQGLNVKGFDVKNYTNLEEKYIFINTIAGKFNKIYFMHSIAHVPNIEEVLSSLSENNLIDGGYLYVITPNKNFDDYFKSKTLTETEYIKDSTVVKHYDIYGLISLFEKLGFIIQVKGQFGKTVGTDIHERLYLIAKK